jgi:RNA polymerase sigma factor (sigma-70 family)
VLRRRRVQRQWYDGSKHGKVSKKAVDQHQFLAERFEADRAHLRSVAYRMLGSISDADDAVQETWLRLSRADTRGVENLTGWLTTVVARVSLDMLRSRTSRREEQFGDCVPEPPASHAERVDPEHEAVLADSVGLALLVVLDTLGPAERLAFVLHDMFAVPFEEIASILGRSPAAAKQLASRARRRVQGAASDDDIETDVARQRAVVDAFLAASREGDFDALVALLDPNVVLRADSTVVKRPRANVQPEVRGALAVAGAFAGRAAGAQTAMIDGFVGAVWAQGGRPRAVFEFRIARGKIVSIAMVADPERLGQLELEVLS